MIEKNSEKLDVEDLMKKINKIIESEKSHFVSVSSNNKKDFTLSAVERGVEEGIQAVLEAENATTVKSKFPKFFNRLLRKQNVVNRKLIKGLKDAIYATWQCTNILYSKINLNSSKIKLLEEKELINQSLINKIQGQLVTHSKQINHLSRHNETPMLNKEIAYNPPILNKQIFEEFCLQLRNQSRGTSGEITEKLKFYLPILDRIQIPRSNSKILDLGCGRGEWLNLLKKNDYTAIGVDIDSSMISECKGFGLEVLQENAISFIENCDLESYKAITCFHLIQYLNLSDLIAIFQHALNALIDGGVFLIESPNPENFQVATHDFYMDHNQKKLFPPTLIEFLAKYTGFREIKVEKIYSSDQDVGLDLKDKNMQKINHWIYGPKNYAIVAKK